MRILWHGPLTDPSGDAAEGRAFVRGLVEEGAAVRVEHAVRHFREAVSPAERERLADLMEVELPGADVSIRHDAGRLLDPYAAGRVRVGRISLPPGEVPRDWAVRIGQMDEVWVPTADQARRLAEAGAGARVAVLPEPLELDRLDPATPPLEVPGAHGTIFLACLEWAAGSGADDVLAAWCEAFAPHDDVTLVLKTWSDDGLRVAQIHERAVAALRARGLDPEASADIVILDDLLTIPRMAALHAAADVVVAPSPDSRVALEAAAMGRPCAAPRPDALRAMHARPDERRSAGAAARVSALAHDHGAVARAALARLAKLVPRPRRARAVDDATPAVLLRGSLFGAHSLAGVNRDLARALLRRGGMALGLVDAEGAALDPADPAYSALHPLVGDLLPRVDVTLRHAWPPRLGAEPQGRVAQFLHWEYGPPPLEWLRAHETTLDEVWAASTHVRDGMVDGGMDPERVALVPLGVDPGRFRPGLPPLPLGDAAPGCRLLFVGGLLWRKGIDLLLDAYAAAFRRDDDVTLVIKDFGARGPYVPQEAALRVAELVADPAAPRVLHLTGALPEADMPRLYAACDALVHPYRGEGYGLPIAEAMACGLPVIVPDRGAARDFADQTTALLVPAREAELPSAEIGGMLLAGRPRVVEVEVADLAAAMRRLYEEPDTAASVAAAASARMRSEHTWERTAEVAGARLSALAGAGAPLVAAR